MKKYIVLVLLPEEPFIVYYCGNNKEGSPAFHEASGLIKQMSLEEAEKVYNTIGAKNSDVTFCLMEWLRFVDVYQSTELTKKNFISNSLKTK